MDDLNASLANSDPLSPLTFLERAAVVYGDCHSIIYEGTTYTWGQTHRRCLQIASSISSLSLGRGHVISVMAPNVPAIYELHFGVPMSGAVLNTINTRLDSRTVSVMLRHSESKLVFVYHQLLPLVLKALSLLPSNHPRPLLVLISDDQSNQVQHSSSNGVILSTYEEMVQKGDPNFEWIQPESDLAPIVLNYTSGTTSAPKGVVHCHKALFIMALNSLIDWAVPNQPVFLWTLPMFHANGWSFTWAMAAVGGTNICLSKLDGATVYSAIRDHHVTHMCGAPVVLNMLINENTARLPHPVHMLTAGASPPAPIIQRAESIGFVVGHGYGLTEVGGVIISCAWNPKWDLLPPSDRARLKARQGVRTFGLTRVEIIHPKTGQPVIHDGKSIGEVVVRGNTVMLGYLKDLEGTLKCMWKDGWYRTGDLGVIHPDGYLELKDRSKDIIISGGENISSVEVETVLYTCPSIREVAVVARPDSHWGETPCAFVTLKQGVVAKHGLEKEIIEYCRERMPHYMVPKTIVFMDELPKTSTGKIQKSVLREMAKPFKDKTTAALAMAASRL